jgi:phosphoribosyl-ATP pyrophosphohydrolase
MNGDKDSKTTDPTGDPAGHPTGACLDRLYGIIDNRRGADPASSHTAKLFHKGRAKIAQKVGEEAVETVIEAIRGDKDLVISESADLLYHLLLLWADCGIKPADIWAKLLARDGVSGIAEKQSRPQ